MIRRIYRLIQFFVNPPKKGDVFYADSFDYIAGKPLEHIFHGMRDKNGDPVWDVIPGKDTYRFTLVSDSMPYYIFTAATLASNRNDMSKKWLLRSKLRRMWKHTFKQSILDGDITRELI